MSNKKIADLKAAEYNPRRISQAKLAGLKKALDEFGNLSDIVYNRRTGNLVTFHQRMKCSPKDTKIIVEKIYDPPTNIGTVAEGYMRIKGERFGYREVDWDLCKEKKANLAANNVGGEFDSYLLPDIIKSILEQEPEIDSNILGFDASELDKLLQDVTQGLAARAKEDEIKKIIEVVVECESEEEQEKIYKRFKKEGLKCRVLTL